MSTQARFTSGAATSKNSAAASKNSAAASAKSAATAADNSAQAVLGVAALVARQGEFFVCVGLIRHSFRFVPSTFSHTKYSRFNRPTGYSTAAASGVESVAFLPRHLDRR